MSFAASSVVSVVSVVSVASDATGARVSSICLYTVSAARVGAVGR